MVNKFVQLTQKRPASPNGAATRTPYGLEMIDSCLTCQMRSDYLFCNLPTDALEALEKIKSAAAYPKGAMLFLEGQNPRGVFILCHGRAKLSTSSSDGKTIILRIAEPGEVLGLSATISGKPYEVTVETLEPCQANFIARQDLLNFLKEFGEVAVRVAQELSNNYHSAYQEIRALGLSSSASEKLAKLLMEWADLAGPSATSKNGELRLTMTLTHEEIAQLIGTSRETVTRIFADLKKKQLIQVKGATLIVKNREALTRLVNS
jgi:CRP/FNR family transcriptional regulator